MLWEIPCWRLLMWETPYKRPPPLWETPVERKIWSTMSDEGGRGARLSPEDLRMSRKEKTFNSESLDGRAVGVTSE